MISPESLFEKSDVPDGFLFFSFSAPLPDAVEGIDVLRFLRYCKSW